MTIVMAFVSGILGAISYHIGLKQGYKQGRKNGGAKMDGGENE